MAVGASVATGLLLVGVMALAPPALLVRGGRSLLHGFKAKLALPWAVAVCLASSAGKHGRLGAFKLDAGPRSSSAGWLRTSLCRGNPFTNALQVTRLRHCCGFELLHELAVPDAFDELDEALPGFVVR